MDQLFAEAKAQLTGLQLTDAEILRLQIQLAIAQTARNTYAKALQAALTDSLIAGVSEGGSVKI